MEISSLLTLITHTLVEVLHLVEFIHYTSFTLMDLHTSLPWANHILPCLPTDFHLHNFDTCFENAIVELEVGIEHLHQIRIHLARKFKECLQFLSFEILLKVAKVFYPQPCVNHLRKDDLLPIDINQEGLNFVFMAFKPYLKPSLIHGILIRWSRWGGAFIISGGCS